MIRCSAVAQRWCAAVRLRTPGAPMLSPDGRWVAFAVTSRDEATNTDPSEVWLVAPWEG